jgi:hypothetical protein
MPPTPGPELEDVGLPLLDEDEEDADVLVVSLLLLEVQPPHAIAMMQGASTGARRRSWRMPLHCTVAR